MNYQHLLWIFSGYLPVLQERLWISSVFWKEIPVDFWYARQAHCDEPESLSSWCVQANVVAELSVLAYCRVEVCNDLAANEVHQALRPAA